MCTMIGRKDLRIWSYAPPEENDSELLFLFAKAVIGFRLRIIIQSTKA